jgi:hypothetical protein
MDKIAIIVTTMFRDDLCETAVESMLKYAPENCTIFIGDQGERSPNGHVKKIEKWKRDRVQYHALPFDCGLSHSRNFLVEQAYIQGFKYVLIASDSMIFTDETTGINDILSYFEVYDVIGLRLNKAEIYWVGWLTMKERDSFWLDFIDRSKEPDFGPIYDCNIIHNFFIAKTSVIREVKWDDKLKLAEHEDFFYRLANAGFKVGYTKTISCDRIKTRDGAHGLYRGKNWTEGVQNLKLKYGIKCWIQYTNRNRGFWGGTKCPVT